MKKVLALLLVVLMCVSLFACTTDSSTDDKTVMADSQKEQLFNGTSSTQSHEDSPYGVGRGVNALEDEYLKVGVGRTSVFDQEKLLDMKWTKMKMREQEAEVISESSASAFQLELAAAYSRKTAASVEVDGIFTAGLDKDFSISNILEVNKDTREIIAKLFHNINGFSVEIEGYLDYRNFYKALSESFIEDLNEIRESNFDQQKIKNLFNFYGTHVVTAGYYGGRVECNYHLMFEDSTLTNSQLLTYRSNAGVALTSARASASLSSGTSFSISDKISENIVATKETFTYKGRGGSYFQGVNIDSFMEGYASWIDSFNEDEENFSVLVDVPDGGLMPIWLMMPENYSDVAQRVEEIFFDMAKTKHNEWLDKCTYVYKDNNNFIDYNGGDGTEYNPYLIANETHLKNISKNIDNGKHFKLENDITITDNRWSPLGTHFAKKGQDPNKLSALVVAVGFNGTLDGNGKTIAYDLNIDLLSTTNDYDYGFGLFGLVKGATFKNINIDAKVYATKKTKGGANMAGLFAGWAIDTTFENCTTSGKVWQDHGGGDSYCCVRSGGFVGIAKNCVFNRCTNNAHVRAGAFYATSGGLVGGNAASSYNVDCINNGKVESNHGSWWFGADNHGNLYGRI